MNTELVGPTSDTEPQMSSHLSFNDEAILAACQVQNLLQDSSSHMEHLNNYSVYLPVVFLTVLPAIQISTIS